MRRRRWKIPPLGFQIESNGCAGAGSTGLLGSSGDSHRRNYGAQGQFYRAFGRLFHTSFQPLLPRDIAELSRAEVVMPSISISNPTAPNVGGAGTAVVQAPLPKPPVVPKPPSPTRVSSLLDFLPSRIPSSKPLVASSTKIGSGESPLRDYESRGGPVYTAAINAPNFTSKRGSWIFRFAELWAVEPPSSATRRRYH